MKHLQELLALSEARDITLNLDFDDPEEREATAYVKAGSYDEALKKLSAWKMPNTLKSDFARADLSMADATPEDGGLEDGLIVITLSFPPLEQDLQLDDLDEAQ